MYIHTFQPMSAKENQLEKYSGKSYAKHKNILLISDFILFFFSLYKKNQITCVLTVIDNPIIPWVFLSMLKTL